MFLKFKLEDWQKQFIVFASLLFSILLFVVPERSHDGDIICWLRWIGFIKTHGLMNVYNSDTEYLPAFQYILYFFSLSKDTIEEVALNIKYFKLIIFVIHLGSSYMVFHFLYKLAPQINIQNGIFYLLNIAVLHNTLVWGQVDEFISFFMVMSLYFILRGNARFGLISFLLALNFKYQAIIFAPVIFFMVLPVYWGKKLKTFLADISCLVLLQFIIFLPFILSGKLGEIWRVISTLVDSQPYISANAFNIWFALIGSEARWLKDSEIFYFFTYKQWGMALFFISGTMALLPIFSWSLKRLLKRSVNELNLNLALLSWGILPLIFFFFCTQMHERYAHAAIIFLVLYSIMAKKWTIGFLVSLAYLLNVEAVLKSLSFQNYGVLIFDSKFIALLFFMLIVLCMYEIYKIASKENLLKL
jgi:Gpi18-like mannosyltransferase